MWKARCFNKEISYSSWKLNPLGRKLMRVGKDRSYWGLSKDFSPCMSKVHVTSVDKKADLIVFLQLHLLQKITFSSWQIESFIRDNLDTEPDSPTLYRKDQFIQIIGCMGDWMHICKVTLKNHVKIKIMALSVTWECQVLDPSKAELWWMKPFLRHCHPGTKSDSLSEALHRKANRQYHQKLYTLHRTQTWTEAEK